MRASLAPRPTPLPTLHDVMNPTRWTRKARDEIRRCSVYCIKVFGDDPDALIVLHRDYQTLDAPDAGANYRAAVTSHFRRRDLSLAPASLSYPSREREPRTVPCLYAYADGPGLEPDAYWLFDDGSQPYRNRRALAAYRALITRIFGVDGLRRIAALCGRDLGPWPAGGGR